MPNQEPLGILFVCLGNICRSPLAEGVFIHLARERGVGERFCVESCGTGNWHVGARPDHRSEAVARRHGVNLPSCARLLDPKSDFERFGLIVPMDLSNSRNVLAAGAEAERVRLLLSFDPALKHLPEHELQVPDPYHEGPEGFDAVFKMVSSACVGMLEELTAPTRSAPAPGLER